MRWNEHGKDLEGTHAFFSGSQYSWLNWSEGDVTDHYRTRANAIRGTKLHDFAAHCIEMGEPLPDIKRTLNMYVNDAIYCHMRPEQVIFYSPNSYGTADAISFYNGYLRIHDLKTGASPGSFHQLEIYASLFFLEYGILPSDIGIELRIYQYDEIFISHPGIDTIYPIMDRIVYFDRELSEVKENRYYVEKY